MVINLSDNVEFGEYIRVTAHGKHVEAIDVVEISFSKEALIGFAKNLIWMYEDIDHNKQFYVCTDPLGGVPWGNQVIGFYLTAGSPALVFRVNSLSGCKGIANYNMGKQPGYPKYINISSPVAGNFIKEYELGFRNLARISIYDINQNDISKYIYEISFEINYEGLKNLAIFLLKLADSYQEGAEYTLEQYNCGSGIILEQNSLPVKWKCSDLGNVYDYESEFGKHSN